MNLTPNPLKVISTTVLLFSLVVPAARPQPVETGDAAPAAVALDLTQLNRAIQELEAGDHELARERLDRLARNPSANRQVYLHLGRVELLLGNYTEAVDALVEASRFRENDYDVIIALAEALRLQSVAANEEANYEIAGMALEDSRRFFEQAAQLRPTAPAPWLGASRVALALGNPDQALQLLVHATTVDPEHVESHVEMGSQRFAIYWKLKGLRGAEAARDAQELCRRAYARALELDPKNGLAMNGLGWVALHGGEQEQAVDWFKQSLLADPTLTNSYECLSQIHSASLEQKKDYVNLLGAVVGAARSFGKGDARRFARAFSLYQRGLAQVASRNVNAMRRDFTEAAKLDHSFQAACNFQIARGLYRDNQYGQAGELILKQAEDDLPGLLRVMHAQDESKEAALMVRSLGDKRYKNNALDQARDLFRIAAEALEDSVSDWNNYAFLCRESASYEDSYAAYMRALELDPGNPALLNDAALILHYHLHRDLERAKELYALAIEEGQRVLEDQAAGADAKETAKVAVQDATNNLKRLEAGIMSEDPPARPRNPDRKPKDRKPEDG